MKTKTKIFALIMAFALVLSLSSFSAFAAEGGQQYSASTTVSYTLRGQYSISIPSSVSVTWGDRLRISTDYLQLIEGESVVITLNNSSFDPHSSAADFMLHSVEGDNSLLCLIMVGLEGGNPEEMYSINRDNAAETPVHTYTADNAADVVEMAFIPYVDPYSVAGEYTGILQFDIALQTQPGA